MSRFFVFRTHLFVVALIVSLTSVSGLSQIKLRNALDFDGDQRADFTVLRGEEHVWYTATSSGNFLGAQWGLRSSDRPVPGDYDGDGKGDWAVWRDATGVWYIINSSNFTVDIVQWGLDGDVPVQRDYDGDGKTDLAIVRRTEGLMIWWVRFSTGGHHALQWGLATDFPVPGDYDGDGKFDYSVQRAGPTPSSQAYFYVIGSQVGFMGAAWGMGTDLAVPGDYDGDGKTDFAVVRGGSNFSDPLIWYAIRSDGQGVIIRQWGVTGDDYTAQGDYDGDGADDIAVWRNSNGLFYVINSSNGSFSGAQWGMDGDYPLATYNTY